MARLITILDHRKTDSGGDDITVALWLTTPTNLVRADQTRASQVPNATADELAAIRAGTITETIFQQQFAAARTAAQIRTFLQKVHADTQAVLTNSAPVRNFIGVSWDGTTWG